MVELVLPFPPSANRYWRVFRGRPVLSAEAKLYKQIVARLGAGLPKLPAEGDLHLQVVIFRPARSRRRDLDNNLKVLLDALQGVVYENDLRVSRITAEHWDTCPERPRVEVVVGRAYLTDGGRLPAVLDIETARALRAAQAEIAALAEKSRTKERTRREKKTSLTLDKFAKYMLKEQTSGDREIPIHPDNMPLVEYGIATGNIVADEKGRLVVPEKPRAKNVCVVKPGQVWQDKNMGRRWTVKAPEVDGDGYWMESESGTDKIVPEHILVDDYVLVTEAP